MYCTYHRLKGRSKCVKGQRQKHKLSLDHRKQPDNYSLHFSFWKDTKKKRKEKHKEAFVQLKVVENIVGAFSVTYIHTLSSVQRQDDFKQAH